MDLNPNQQKIVEQKEGNLLVVAGPGTGKTATMAHFIVERLQEGVDFKHILAITFTNKAAHELKERVQRLLENNFNIPFIGTFHAYGWHLIQYFQKTNNETSLQIASQEERFEVIKNMIQTMDSQNVFHHIPNKKNVPQFLADIISAYKNGYPEKYLNSFPSLNLQDVENWVKIYDKKLQNLGKIDIDDLIIQAGKIMQNVGTDRDLSAESIKYILIDEYQDINNAQYKFIQQLKNEKTNIIAIGDPDQAIYGFRGANLDHFLEFQHQDKNVQTFYLKENYRSGAEIVNLSQVIIQKNTKRIAHEIKPKNEKPASVKMIKTSHEWQEMEILKEEIEIFVGGTNIIETHQKYDELFHFSDIAVLVRTNMQKEILQSYLEKQSIPCKTPKPLSQYPEIQIIIQYCNLILNPENNEAFLSICNIPEKGLGKEIQEILQQEQIKTQQPILHMVLEDAFSTLIPQEKEKIISAFCQKIKNIQLEIENMQGSQVVKYIVEQFELESYIKNSMKRGEERFMNILLLYSLGESIRSAGKTFLQEFLDLCTLMEEDLYTEKRQAVSVMTLHASKGLEFPIVFIMGCEDGCIPFEPNALKQSEIEEERRLLYVGITRAKQYLYLLYAEKRKEESQKLSRFLEDIPTDSLEREDAVSKLNVKREMKKKQMSLW